MYIKWTDLKREIHIKLACGCEGFVKSIHYESDPLLSGFVFLYTKSVCDKDLIDLDSQYMLGKGPFQFFFNQALAENAMPAELATVPSWWKELQANKTNPEQVLP